MIIVKHFLLGLGLTIAINAVAQEQPAAPAQTATPAYTDQVSPLPAAYPPLRSIPATDRMFSKRIWRMMDMREKQNRPLFSKDRWISRIMIDAVRRGELTAYENDSLEAGKTLTREEFLAKLVIPAAGGGLSEEEKQAGLKDDWGGGFDEPGEAKPTTIGPQEFFAQELYTIELVEDLIFDKKRSRLYNEIRALTLYVPADLSTNPRAILIPLGTFKYSDLVKVFRSDPNAIWFNPQNDAQHKNMADAMALRLFNSYIVKVSNPAGDRLEGAGKQSLYAASRIQEDLIEYEYNLWSY